MLNDYDRGWHDGHMHALDIIIGACYTHRNGEVDNPTQDGQYWVWSKADDKWVIDEWDVNGWATDYGYDPEYTVIYGPIPQPRREQPHAVPD